MVHTLRVQPKRSQTAHRQLNPKLTRNKWLNCSGKMSNIRQYAEWASANSNLYSRITQGLSSGDQASAPLNKHNHGASRSMDYKCLLPHGQELCCRNPLRCIPILFKVINGLWGKFFPDDFHGNLGTIQWVSKALSAMLGRSFQPYRPRVYRQVFSFFSSKYVFP